jgi:hypothetical protein
MAKASLENKIARLEADLKEAKAMRHSEARKDRNAQLIAFGIMLETKFNNLPIAEREKVRTWADALDTRNKERVLAGFARLDQAKKHEIADYEEAGPERLFLSPEALKEKALYGRPDSPREEL